jgi:hypothetical protein
MGCASELAKIPYGYLYAGCSSVAQRIKTASTFTIRVSADLNGRRTW